MSQANHPAPFAVSVPGRVTVDLKGHDSAVVPFTIRDSGTQPLAVTLSAGTFTVNEQQYPGASWVTSIRPAVLHLRPGQSKTVHLTITVPPGAAGTHYAGIEALASVASPAVHGSQAHVGGAVASALVLQRPGTVAPVAPAQSAADYAAPVVISTLFALVGLLVLAGVLLRRGLRRRRERRRLARPGGTFLASQPQRHRHRAGVK